LAIKNWHGQGVSKHLPAEQSMDKSHLPLPKKEGVGLGGWLAAVT